MFSFGIRPLYILASGTVLTKCIVVSLSPATDIFDKELSALRKKRWNKAFEVADKDATQEDVHRKATIVIEHLIQASDVSHTMQHWQVYLKVSSLESCWLIVEFLRVVGVQRSQSITFPSFSHCSGTNTFLQNSMLHTRPEGLPMIPLLAGTRVNFGSMTITSSLWPRN